MDKIYASLPFHWAASPPKDLRPAVASLTADAVPPVERVTGTGLSSGHSGEEQQHQRDAQEALYQQMRREMLEKDAVTGEKGEPSSRYKETAIGIYKANLKLGL